VAQRFRAYEETTYNAETAEPTEKNARVFSCVFCEFCVQRRIPSQALQRCEEGLNPAPRWSPRMIRKLTSGKYRLYSRKKNPKTGKRRNLGTFATRAAAERHERAVQFFKRH
jgi:hypothetical protein